MILILKRWHHKLKLIIYDVLSYIGIFWLLIEITSHSTSGATDIYTKNVIFVLSFFCVFFILASYLNRPRTSFAYKLRGRDNFIELRVGDAFKNEGALIIPINDNFDVKLGGNVKKSSSIQKQLIDTYYAGREEHLEIDISSKIDMSKKHDIGTIIEIEQSNKVFYLMVNSRKKPNNRVESSVDDFVFSLLKLWEYIAKETGRNAVVTIPLINTNHGRMTKLNRSGAIKEIIQSYIDGSKYLNIADKLIISIYSGDLKKGNIDLDELDEFLKFSCKHYRQVDLTEKPIGEPLSASQIHNINN